MLNILFVIGLPRSGTSLVHKLVHEHTDRKAPKFRDFGIDVSRVPARIRELNKCFDGPDSLAEDNDFPYIDQSPRIEGLRDYRDWLEVRGDKWVCKSPDHLGRMFDLLEVFPEAKFLWCVRDGSGTMQSIHEYFSITGLRWPYDPIKALKDSLRIAKAHPEIFTSIYTPSIPEWEPTVRGGYDSIITQDVDYIQGQLKGLVRNVSSRDFKELYS